MSLNVGATVCLYFAFYSKAGLPSTYDIFFRGFVKADVIKIGGYCMYAYILRFIQISVWCPGLGAIRKEV